MLKSQFNRMYNALGFLLVIIAFAIQSWLSIFPIGDDVRLIWFDTGLILLLTGSVILATENINWLFNLYHRINYVIAIIGLVGLIVLLFFRVYLENILSLPTRMIVYSLILDLFWMFLLGLILPRFKTTAYTEINTN